MPSAGGAGPDRDEVVLSLQTRNRDRHQRFQLTDLPDRIGADQESGQVMVLGGKGIG